MREASRCLAIGASLRLDQLQLTYLVQLADKSRFLKRDSLNFCVTCSSKRPSGKTGAQSKKIWQMYQNYWLPLALPISFVSISASVAPDQWLDTFAQSERFIILFILAILAVATLAAAAMDESV